VEKREDCKWKMSACNNIEVCQLGSIFIPGGLDFLRFAFAHNPATLRDRRQSIGQLHGWSGGVASTRLLLNFLLCQGASAFCGLAAGQSLGYLSPLGFGGGAGEEVVRSRDVGLWRVAPVHLCESVLKIFG
jgi:hypothetical protein